MAPSLGELDVTTQFYRPGAHPSNLRSMSSTIARTAIPITHYRILTKEQPAATPRLVALRSSRDRERERSVHANAIASIAAHKVQGDHSTAYALAQYY